MQKFIFSIFVIVFLLFTTGCAPIVYPIASTSNDTVLLLEARAHNRDVIFNSGDICNRSADDIVVIRFVYVSPIKCYQQKYYIRAGERVRVNYRDEDSFLIQDRYNRVIGSIDSKQLRRHQEARPSKDREQKRDTSEQRKNGRRK